MGPARETSRGLFVGVSCALALALLASLATAAEAKSAAPRHDGMSEDPGVPKVRVKRFKTSPFAWSNPLSGYSVVLVRLPGFRPQIQVVRNKENPYSRVRSPLLPDAAKGRQRNNYVIKWLDDQADGNAKEDEEDVGADADEALASGAELLRRSGIVLGDQILDEEEEKEEEDEDVAELQSPYRERLISKKFWY